MAKQNIKASDLYSPYFFIDFNIVFTTKAIALKQLIYSMDVGKN